MNKQKYLQISEHNAIVKMEYTLLQLHLISPKFNKEELKSTAREYTNTQIHQLGNFNEIKE